MFKLSLKTIFVLIANSALNAMDNTEIQSSKFISIKKDLKEIFTEITRGDQDTFDENFESYFLETLDYKNIIKLHTFLSDDGSNKKLFKNFFENCKLKDNDNFKDLYEIFDYTFVKKNNHTL